MSLEELICRIIEKVRRMYQYDPSYKYIVAEKAHINLKERDGKLVLDSIEFRWYDNIVVHSNKITYHPEHGYAQTILSYRDFYQLLEM